MDETGTLTDDETFLAAVEATTWPGERFGHREHVWLAWLYLGRHGLEQGSARLRESIQRYATALGAPGKYHETLTWAWSVYVDHALRGPPRCATFPAFLEAHPHLLDGRLLARHYRRETLETPEARRERLAPDLEPLPGWARTPLSVRVPKEGVTCPAGGSPTTGTPSAREHEGASGPWSGACQR